MGLHRANTPSALVAEGFPSISFHPPCPHPCFQHGESSPLPAFFLLFLLLAGFVPPAAAQSTPTVSLQPDNVLTMMGLAVPTEIYSSFENDGLLGASDAAVSDDLLFVTGDTDNALSVWRVNAEASTLRQTAFYENLAQDDENETIRGLSGASNVAVSGDGNLLFVTGLFDHALSVWRVNASSGTLRQTALYQDQNPGANLIADVDGRFIGLSNTRDVAVSDDDDLLFVTSIAYGGLSVWRVNASSGTLRQTAFYRDGTPDNENKRVSGLGGAWGLAVSNDLLFVTAVGDDALSVWRMNAEADDLAQTALYQDSGVEFPIVVDDRLVNGLVDGLGGAFGLAVSNDLLFVTAVGDDALSVWRVNRLAGTLRQTALYQDPDADNRIEEVDGRFDGLDEASVVAVSNYGDLLFVTAIDTLSVWRVNAQADTLTQTVRYQDDQLGEDIILSLRRVSAATVSDDGNLLFVTANVGNALSVWPINDATVPLELQTVIRLQSNIPVAQEVMVTVIARNSAGMEKESLVTFSPNSLSEEAIFPAGTLSPGRWIFTAQADLPDALNTRVARTAVRVIPLLSLEPQQKQFSLGNTVTLAVRANAGVPMEATYEIFAENMASAMTASIIVTHPAGVTSQEVSFSAQQIASPGQWEFFIRLPDNSPFRVGDGSTATVHIVLPLLQLVPLQDLFALGSTVILTVRADTAAPTAATYEIFAENMASVLTSSITVTHPANVAAQEVSFSAQQIASPGQWEFSIRLPDGSPFQVIANGTATVHVASVLSLRPQRELFPAGVALNIEVRADSPPAVDAAVTITAQQDGVEVAAEEAVMLSAEVLSGQAVFPAGALSAGVWVFTAQSEPPQALYTANARAEAAVSPPLPIMLEVSAPPSVTVGSTFPVTVGVATGTSLPESVSVTATVSFRAGNDEERKVVLRSMMSSDTLSFTAPVTAGIFRVAVSGQVEETAALRVTVTGASAAVTVVPVAVMLRLSDPAEAVSVGQRYPVIVDTAVPVPAGTTLEVTVSDGTALRDVFLANTISSTPVFFTAPARAGEVMVTATAAVQTSTGSRQVAVSDAATLTVGVSAREVPLVLLEFPLNLVAAGSTFPVTVGAAPEVPAGTTLMVTVHLADFSSELVLLTPAAPTASVLVIASAAAGGSATLRATGEAADDSTLELNVLAAEAAVQVTELVTLELRLSTPSAAVEAGSTFSVMVETDGAVPAGAEVSLTVTFDGVTRPAVLSEGEDMIMVEFTAPGTMTGSFAVNATGTASVTDLNALELTLIPPASASVQVVPVAIALTLTPTSIVVRANAMFSVEVGTDRELPGGTEVALIVRFGSASAPVVLSAATMPTDSLEFTAPSEGLLELTAEVSATTQGDITVEVSEATPVMVQVTRLAALGLRLSTPSAAVAAGSKFSVTVGADAPVPAEVSVLVTFEEFTQPAMLSANTPMAMVEFTAPGTTGTFAVEAAGIAEDSDALELTVNPASASVEVVPMAITLTLTPSSLVVAAGAQLSVEVGTDLALPAGTEVNVELQFNGASTSAVVSSMMPAPSVTFMASSLGELSLTAPVITIAQSSPVVAVSAPAPLRVRVIRSINLAVVTPSGAEVITGSTFTVTVRTDVPVPAETEMSVIVTFAGSTRTAILSAGEEETTVQLTAPESTGTFTVNATGMASVADPNALELTVNPASAPVQVNALLTIRLTVSAPSSVMVGDTFTVTVGVAEGRLLPESISVTATVGFRAANAEELQAETVVLSAAIPSDTRVFTAPVTAGVYTVEVSGQVEEEMEFLRVIVTGANASVIVNPVAVRLRLSGPEAAVPAAQTYMITVDTNVVVPQGTTLRVTVSVNDGIGAQEQEVFLAAGNFSEQVSFTAPGGRAGAVSVRAMVTDVQTAPDALEVAVSNAERLIVRLSALDLQLVPGRDRYAVGSEVTLRVRADAGPMTDTTYSIIAMNIDSTTTFSRAVMHPEGVTEQEVSFPARLFSSTGQWKFSILLPADSPFQAVNSASVFIFPPALSLRPDDVLTIMGLALPTEIYSRSETSGLSGASDAAVSGDLLFVTGDTDNALSVWRVNAEASTLRQIALYENLAQDDENETIRGLSGARNVAVSGDGNLLFVTGPRDHALSVWRVNASSGTLRQTALYQDQNPGANLIADVDGRFIGLSDTRDVAVSDDDDLLFVTSSFYAGLSVWRVNASSGTLRQTVFYRNGNPDNENKRVSGLNGAWGLAVSNDLLFVTALGDDALSVWRVNAEASDLAQTALYQDSGSPPSVLDDRLVNGRVDGLNDASGLAVSNDLLFVTALGDDALSVWRVNRLAGTLRQTALYQDPDADNRIEEVDGRFDGLDQASVVAVSNDGALLFVSGSDTTGETDLHTLSIWRVNAQAETLTQTARYQSGDQPSVREVSAATVSDDGNLLFVVAGGFNALSVWPINDATVPLGVQTVIRLQSNIPVAQEVMVTVIARNSAGMEKEILVTFSPDSLSEEAIFPAGTLSPGRWIFTAQADLPDALNTGAARTAVRVLLPLLSLEPRQKQFALGSTVLLTVRADPGALTAATYNIIARHLTSPTTFPLEVMHPAEVTEREVSFSAQQIASPGQWEFSIQLPEDSPFQVIANGTAMVYVAPVLSLRLQGEAFSEGDPLNIEVRADSPPAVDAAVTITARRQQDGVEMDAAEVVMLSPAPEVSSGQAVFSAGALGAGEWVFTAQSEPPQALYIANARAEATVLPRPLMLEVSAPPSVTVGSTFPVTVGVAEETPLAEGISVTATVSFRAAEGEEIQAETAVLTAMRSSATRVFRAPVTAGIYTVAVSGEVEETVGLPVTVTGASAAVTVVPVAVMLRLRGPNEVSVGQDYTVMVDTALAVPTGTTLEVTVRAGTATALQKEVSLTETISRLPVSFTAPARADEVMVTATALAQTSSGSRQVAVSDAVTLTVEVSAREVQLVLSEVPLDLVAAESTFSVTVSAVPTVLAGTTVQVTVRLAAFASEPVLLTPGAPTASVLVTAPAADGAATLSATGEEADDNRLELNVLPAQAVVRVQLQASLSLRLDAPPEVTARDSFAVTVSTEPDVPGGATVTVTVVFDGTDSSPVVLSAEMSSTTVILTARRIGNNLALMTSSVVTVAEPNALQVMVADADASVNAVAQSVELTLMVSPQRVNIGEEIEVTVGVFPALLADTTLTVEVMADAASEEVTLTDATPSRQVRFTAMEAGPLEVRAQVSTVVPAELVTVENTPTQTVQVQEEGTVDLTLDAPSSVTVGNTFTVTVGVAEETLLQEGVSVTATVGFGAADSEVIIEEMDVTLTTEQRTATEEFTAPVTAGVYTLAVSGQVEETAALRVTVTGASAAVTVVPVAVMLRLNGPAEAVSVGQVYTVMVDTTVAVPAGTTLEVTVRAGTATALQKEVSLTETISRLPVSFTAPARADEVMVTATALAQTSSGSRQVAVSDAVTLTVGVSAREVQLVLSEVPLDLVAAESTFSVTVSAAPAVLADTTVQVTVRLAAFASEPVLLTLGAPMASVLVTAPATGGEMTLSATGEEADDNRLELNVLPTQAAVQVQVQASLSLRLDAPPEVMARDSFAVTVFTEPEVPGGATVTVTVVFDGTDSSPVVLSAEMSSTTVILTARRIGNNLALMTSSVVTVAEPNALRVMVADADASVNAVAQSVELTLMVSPQRVNIGEEIEVTVGVFPTLLADTTLTVEVMADAESEEVTLTDATPSRQVRFTAMEAGPLEVRAQVSTVAPADLVTVENTPTQTVQVQEEGTVDLTLDAPKSVTVGSTFPVTVEVAEEMPLAGGVSVTATVSFRAVGGEEIQAETAVLTAMRSSATRVFRAPVTAGVYTVAVSGEVEETVALPVTVTGASASVTVVPVAVMLRLNGPAEAVSVGQDYTVMVDTTVAVPAGTTLEVTVRAGTATALQKEVSLTETISRLPVSFTAPARADEVMVTATALAQTSSGSRQVAVSDAVTLTVGVSAREVQLVLSEVPLDLVAAESTFSVTVSAAPTALAGTTVQVTVRLAAFASEPVLLTPGAPTASVLVTAPAADGAATLSATGEEADDNRLELNVLPAQAVVRVQVQASLSLRLDAPPEVTARDSFAVTVFTEPDVPGGATVTVTVVFDGTDSSPVVLSAEMSSTAVILTARRIGNNLALMTSSVVTVAEPNALQVMVADADASVNAVAQSVELTLIVSPQRVNIGEEIEVTVGVFPALLADTTLTVEVMADAASEEVTLTDATPSRQVRFTAMEAGPLEVRAQVSTVAPADLVTVENTPTQTVQVQEEGTVELTLDAPSSVTVGNTFTVTVRVAEETPLAGSISVTATVSFRAAGGEEIQAETAVLTAMRSSATRIFRAPVTAGVYTVAVSGQVEETAALRVTVTGASAAVTAVPVAVMLRLNGPAEAVSVGQDYTVMVDTTVAVPAGTTLEVTVHAGTDLQEVLLTAAIPSTQVFLTAPARAGEVMVTATALAQTSSGSRQVAVSDAVTLTVGVSAREVQLVLSEVPLDLVAAESTFSVTVSAAPTVLAGTTVQVTVRLAAFASEPVLLTPGAPTASVLVTAPAADGEMTLSVTGEEAADNRLELNVLPAEAAVQVQVSLSLRLVPLPEQFALGSTVILTVQADSGAPTEATYNIIARHLALATTFSIEVIHPARVTAQEVSFSARQIASPGQWEFSIQLPEGSPFQVIANGTATVYVAPALSLRLQGEDFSEGDPLNIEVQADSPPAVAAAVTITARRQQDGVEVNAAEAVMLSPAAEASSGQAVFSAGALGAGVWVFTAQSEPPQALYTANARAEATVLPPSLMLEVSAPPSVTVGSTFPVTVGVAEERPLAESVSVTATVSFRAADGGEIQAETVVLTSARSSARATFTAPDTAGRYTVAVRGADGSLLPVIGTTVQMTVEPVLVLDVPSAPIYREVMFPVRVRLLGGLLGDNGSVDVTVYLRNAVTGVAASTRAATLSTAASSMVLMFEAIAGEAAVTAYSLTTEDIDKARLAPRTRAVLSLQSAAPATVFVTRINADLSGNGVFDADDAVLIARGLLTKNYLARSAGDLSQLGPDALQARLSELADFADISGNGGLDIIDLVFLTRNADATASDLQSRVNADDNPFAYLCGSTASNACEGINSRHQNITLPGGIQYEVIGEMLDSLRRVPQPPMLPSPNNP